MRHSVLLLSAAALSAPAWADPLPEAAPAGSLRGTAWADPALSPDVRATRAEAAMTQDEKIAMVNGTLGSRLRVADPGERRIGAGHVAGVPRLGIPDLYETDAGMGVANSDLLRPGDVATAMPSSLAIAASFDPAIAQAGGAAMGAEARAKGFNVMLAGGANLVRDAWNGRNFEYFGEDPLLTGTMAGASIRGVQSNGIIATVKHMALNAQETGRYVANARLDEAAMRESDLLAFQLAIERGAPGAVMCAYNKVDGDWSCENRMLLTDALRRDWHFSGWVMSDWGATHSAAKAANAGLDQQSGQEYDAAPFFAKPLKEAVASGVVSQARLDEMVHRILRTMFAAGIVDHPPPAQPVPIDYTAHADAAQSVAEAGIVMLRNAARTLPLSGKEQRIVVFGAHADAGVLSGGGSSQVFAAEGSPVRRTPYPGDPGRGFLREVTSGSSPLDALRQRAPGTAISYVDTTDPAAAAAIARTADVAIVFAHQWRGEAVDLPSLALPDDQDALIAAVAAANPRSVVVLETGGAVLMPWLGKVGAVIEAWYPGQRGGAAIARLLYGDVDPGGRLPVTFPADAAQLPRPVPLGLAQEREAMARYRADGPQPGEPGYDVSMGVHSFDIDYPEGADPGYRWFERRHAQPLFPFGYGLSYTQFAYSALTVSGRHVRFTVTNRGDRAGVDVPQVYAAPDRAMRRLVGFRRVQLAPGQSETVDVDVDPRLVSRFDVVRHDWIAPHGAVAIAVAPNAAPRSAPPALQATIQWR